MLGLCLEGKFRKKSTTFDFASFRFVCASFVPRQPNVFDCRVFVSMFMQSGWKIDLRLFSVNEICYFSICFIKYIIFF